MTVRYWVGFSKVSGIGPARLRALLDYYQSIEAAWHANPGELRAINLDKRAVESLVKTRQSLDLDKEMARLEKLGVTVLTWDSPDYPSLLTSLPDAPPVLYIRGQLLPVDALSVAVVGTRDASTYGKECTRMLVNGLAKNGVTVISGLAYGIDTEAHQAALQARGRTLAVLGCGVDITYPPENRALSEHIVAHGALVSEYPLGTRPEAGNFPRRNRIISGLSLGVLFVEGSIQSGAKITVKYALEQGRDVFAVPGSILEKGASGPNHYIQNGAKLVMQAQDILEELNLTMVNEHTEARTLVPDNEIEATLLKHLSRQPIHVDELGAKTQLPSAELSSTLVMMELKGMVRHVGGMNYVLY